MARIVAWLRGTPGALVTQDAPTVAQVDPFAHHPMSCKCYFHR